MSTPILMPFQDLPFNGDSFVCKEFLKLRDELELNVAVETGSCLYSTTEWLGKHFLRVHTVEINPEFAKHGKHKIDEMINVFPEMGDSVAFLKQLVEWFAPTDRVIYFLDAHWGNHCPLIDELTVLASSKTLFPPVIVIHDWYTGDEKLGWDEYNGQRFEYSWIEPVIKQIEQSLGCIYTHYFNTEAENGMRGLIYLVPKSSWAHKIGHVYRQNSEGLSYAAQMIPERFSQCGEEAYIDFILANLPGKGRHLVELGAWDGYHLSNTRHFINKGYTHLLIDGDSRGNNEVKEHFILQNNILDILENYNTPIEFDLLCVDLDGNDLYIIDTILSKYKPSLIVAEFNPAFDPHESKVIQYDDNHRWNEDDYYGFSFAAGLKMAEKNGYVCVFQNDNLNMYFVRKDMVDTVPEVTYTKSYYHKKSNRNMIDY